MRRPHVYERSAPRARRSTDYESGADYEPAARTVLAVVPALLREVEAAGAEALARYLGQALTEAEGIVRRDIARCALRTVPASPQSGFVKLEAT